MTENEIKEVLLWCLGINYTILLVWFIFFTCVHEFVYRMHARWFKLSVETFDGINYAVAAIYQVGILMFNLVPLLAIYFSS
jgi:hypothetical protein